MKSACYLAWRYTTVHKGRTLILIAALGVLLLLPTAITLVVRAYDARMGDRAQATPMLIGAKGNRYDLMLQALFFRDGRTEDVPFGLVQKVENDLAWNAHAIPLYARHTAETMPIVGTNLPTYFAFRRLAMDRGAMPNRIGQAVLGASVARRLALNVGDTITTDRVNLYDLSRTMPLELNIAGILRPSNSVDDEALFVDIKTAWIIAGKGHGHAPNAHASPATHAAAVAAIRITPENADTFHFHDDESDLPLSAILVLPQTDKDRTLITSRYNASTTYQALQPEDVMNELMGLVLRIKRLFDANTAAVGLAVVLLTGLVVTLSMKLREAERKTLHKLGCGRWLIVQTQLAELIIVLIGAMLIVAIGSVTILWLSPTLLGI